MIESIHALRRAVKNGTATLADFDTVSTGYGTETDLLMEAQSLFRDGLIDEAHHRLNLWTRPKWHSEGECLAAYTTHMKAQRAAQSPTSGDVP